VRVAAALVAGQAALCAVIGWVTFGAPEQAPPTASRQVAPLDGGPIGVPPASMAMPRPAAPADTTTSPAPVRPRVSAPAPRPPKVQAPARSRSTTAAEEPPTTLAGDSAQPPEPPTPSPHPEMSGTEAPMLPPVQENVIEGDPCDPPGDRGRTAEGVDMLCVRDGDGASWQIN
jgi:hypothetical protein